MFNVFIVVSLLLVAQMASAASAVFYVKSGENKLERTTKKQATINLLLHKGEVYKCQQQEVTDKVTLKSFDPEDQKSN